MSKAKELVEKYSVDEKIEDKVIMYAIRSIKGYYHPNGPWVESLKEAKLYEKPKEAFDFAKKFKSPDPEARAVSIFMKEGK